MRSSVHHSVHYSIRSEKGIDPIAGVTELYVILLDFRLVS